MLDYITQELPSMVAAKLPLLQSRLGIMGHSMGGHGALVAALPGCLASGQKRLKMSNVVSMRLSILLNYVYIHMYIIVLNSPHGQEAPSGWHLLAVAYMRGLRAAHEFVAFSVSTACVAATSQASVGLSSRRQRHSEELCC